MTMTSASEETSPPAADHRAASNMLIQRLRCDGILSIGRSGLDLSMEPLNVLIGPNGSGKSNFIEVLALLQAAPRDLSAPIRRMGGISEWFWKGSQATTEAGVEVAISYPNRKIPLRHVMMIGRQQGEHFEVRDELISDEHPNTGAQQPDYYFRFRMDKVRYSPNWQTDPAGSAECRTLDRNSVNRDASILSQREDPDLYPGTRLAAAAISQNPPVPELGVWAGRRTAPVAPGG